MKLNTLLILFCTFASFPALADTQHKLNAAMTDLAVSVGAATSRAYFRNKSATVEAPTPNLGLRVKELRSVGARYKSYRNDKLGYIQDQKALFDAGITASVAVVVASGPLSPLALAFTGAVKLTGEVGFHLWQGHAEKQVSSFLASQKPAITNALQAGIEWDNYDSVRASLEDANVFKDLKEQFGSDEDAMQMAIDLSINDLRMKFVGITDNFKARVDEAFDGIQANKNSINTLRNDFLSFRDQTIADFKTIDSRVDRLEDTAEKLAAANKALFSNQKLLAANQEFLTNIVFSNSNLRGQAALIRSGSMDARLSCPKEEPSCNKAELRNKIANQLDARADLKKVQDEVAFAMGQFNSALAIATDLGIEVPDEVNEVARVSNALAGAFMKYPTDPLGMVASITGIFANRSDPDQERHRIMMNYLGAKFAEVNFKLDTIIENQKRISKQIQAVSVQIGDMYTALDERLQNIEFEVKSISEIVRRQVWAEWEPCYSIYDRVTGVADDRYGYQRIGDFPSLNQLRRAAIDVNNEGLTLISNCVNHAVPKLASLANPSVFGTFLRIETAMNQIDDGLLVKENESKFVKKSHLRAYDEQVTKPTRFLLAKYIEQSPQVTWTKAFASFQRPAQSAIELLSRNAIDGLENCGQEDDGSASQRVGQLLGCRPGLVTSQAQTDVMAETLLSKPIWSAGALEITDWMLVVSRLMPLVGSDSPHQIFTVDQLIEQAKAGDAPTGSGRASYRLLDGTLRMLDLALISHISLHGDITALAAYDAISTPGEEKDGVADPDRERFRVAAKLLGNNSYYLRSNVAVLMLNNAAIETSRKRCEAENSAPGNCIGSKPGTFALQTAANIAYTIDNERPFALLEQIFGPDVGFERVERLDAEGKSFSPKAYDLFVVLAKVNDTDLTSCEGDPENCSHEFKLLSPWPGDKVVEHGQLFYPSQAHRIQTARAKVVDRLFDLEMLSEVDRSNVSEITVAAELLADLANAEFDAIEAILAD